MQGGNNFAREDRTATEVRLARQLLFALWDSAASDWNVRLRMLAAHFSWFCTPAQMATLPHTQVNSVRAFEHTVLYSHWYFQQHLLRVISIYSIQQLKLIQCYCGSMRDSCTTKKKEDLHWRCSLMITSMRLRKFFAKSQKCIGENTNAYNSGFHLPSRIIGGERFSKLDTNKRFQLLSLIF